MKPMLARTYNPSTFSSFPCYLQPKLNGIRCLYSGNNFQSRDEKLFPSFLLAHIQRELDSLSLPKHYILDGELYKHGWSLGRINGAMATNRKEENEDSKEIEYHIFDFINTQTLDSDFESRCPETWNPNLQYIKRVPTLWITDKIWIKPVFLDYTSQGYEGVMLRVPSFPYEPGEHKHRFEDRMVEYRSKSLWKYKAWMDAEFLCVSTAAGIGKADIGIGALICSTKAGNLFNVGTGFEDSERIAFAASPPIGQKIKVKFIGYSDDGVPLNPSFLCVMP